MSLPEHLALVSKRLRRANGPWARHVLYIDRGILVLNKPPGLVSQASAPQNHAGSASEYDALIHQLKTHLQLDELYPVHRLDKPTTGALVLARTKHLAQELSRQFRSRAIDKTYLALVRGGEKTFAARSGTIQGHLHFDDGRVSIAAGPAKEGTKPALTEWELLSSSPNAPISLLRLRLCTGLKHQLRIHAAHVLKAPILGDVRYGSAKLAPQIGALTQLPEDRMFLHASHIALNRYRRSGPHKLFRLGITAPLPPDFLEICRDTGIELPNSELAEGGLYIDDIEAQDGLVPGAEGLWLRPGASDHVYSNRRES